ncbi:MAG: hypothetical protein Q9170_006425 [Blastenia crenularia]
MDSHPFGWPHDGAYTPFHNLIGASSRTSSAPAGFLVPYQGYVAANTQEAQRGNEVLMGDYETEPQPAPSAPEAQSDVKPSRRARSEQLDWNAHKKAIKKLYIDQNKSLPETMAAMNEQHSFKASQKLYKTKFKEWNWQKNLSTDTALKMREKARRRKRDEGKDTVFSFGGRIWDSSRVESTIVRTKKPKVTIDLTDVLTPEGVSYKTPKALVESPAENLAEHPNEGALEIQDLGAEDSSDDDDYTDVESSDEGALALQWRGHSRADLQEMWRTALAHRNAGNFDTAENMLSRTLDGLGHIIGKTNDDTVRAALNLADLYATSGRMSEATDLLEKMIQNHLEAFGHQDRRTQKRILHAVELLNGWNREADALALLSQSRELLESSPGHRMRSKADNSTRKKVNAVQDLTTGGLQLDLSGATKSVFEDKSPTGIDYGLGVARTHIAAKNGATEGLLLAIISQCERDPGLHVQHLKALGELLELYGKLGQAAAHRVEFRDTLTYLSGFWDTHDWREDSIESLDCMEAALQLVANALKYGYQQDAKRMFRMASEKSSAVFGWEDERTVWVNITIGLVYQTRMTWDDAEEWFEQAYAAALANNAWGPKDGIVRSLQNAIDRRHFSYVSDEGRPYKTIFGVSGMTIRPGRLHLE